LAERERGETLRLAVGAVQKLDDAFARFAESRQGERRPATNLGIVVALPREPQRSHRFFAFEIEQQLRGFPAEADVTVVEQLRDLAGRFTVASEPAPNRAGPRPIAGTPRAPRFV